MPMNFTTNFYWSLHHKPNFFRTSGAYAPARTFIRSKRLLKFFEMFESLSEKLHLLTSMECDGSSWLVVAGGEDPEESCNTELMLIHKAQIASIRDLCGPGQQLSPIVPGSGFRAECISILETKTVVERLNSSTCLIPSSPPPFFITIRMLDLHLKIQCKQVSEHKPQKFFTLFYPFLVWY